MDTISAPTGVVMFERGQRYELRATLAYDRKEPYEVRVLFPPGLEYLDLVLDRELLSRGMIEPATFGVIRVWPDHDSRWAVHIGWTGPAGEVQFEADAVTVQHFLNLSYRLVPQGAEPPRTDIDTVIAAILTEGGPR